VAQKQDLQHETKLDSVTQETMPTCSSIDHSIKKNDEASRKLDLHDDGNPRPDRAKPKSSGARDRPGPLT
jgi:hypothetical protein